MSSGSSSSTLEEEPDYRRWSDNILHWQERPYVYPFSSTQEGKVVQTAPAACTMYSSDYIAKPIVYRKIRPVSITRRNKPHPKMAFHFGQSFNRSVPVVRTTMTKDELNKRPVQSPLVSTTHRAFRHLRLKTADKARSLRNKEVAADGVVPELIHEQQDGEVRLFPVIPRNARLTADRAQKITNAMIRPRKSKYQPNLKGMVGELMQNEAVGTLPVPKPSLKPAQNKLADSLEVPSWDGAPVPGARTRSQVLGRKRMDETKIEPAAEAVVPDVPKPKSLKIMFNEYSQYPKFAPQILEEFYRKRRRNMQRQHVW